MKEGKKIQLNYLRYQIFIHPKGIHKKRKLSIIASGRVG
jgi:hypothetical protein